MNRFDMMIEHMHGEHISLSICGDDTYGKIKSMSEALNVYGMYFDGDCGLYCNEELVARCLNWVSLEEWIYGE